MRLKPLFRNASKLTRRLSKTKGNPKAGIPSKHLENGVGSDFGAPFGHRYVFGLFSNLENSPKTSARNHND